MNEIISKEESAAIHEFKEKKKEFFTREQVAEMRSRNKTYAPVNRHQRRKARKLGKYYNG